MMYFTGFSAVLVIFTLQESRALDFTLNQENVKGLQKVEERLLPALDEFITNKEEHLKELEKIISQTATVKTLSSESVEGYLGTPLNQYFTIKRFVDDWGTLTELLDSDSSNKGEFVTKGLSQKQIMTDAVSKKLVMTEKMTKPSALVCLLLATVLLALLQNTYDARKNYHKLFKETR